MTAKSKESINYVICCSTPWFWQCWKRHALAGKWKEIHSKEAFNKFNFAAFAARYVFFPHWSYKVPSKMINEYECICFHMTPLPYGRGGSPLQNMIIRGHKKTLLSALRMNEKLDAGPVYLQTPLSLSGSAGEIYLRAAKIIMEDIQLIIKGELKAKPQKGRPVYFFRRTPEQSAINFNEANLGHLYDFIRMLDADGYPHAFTETKDVRLEFRHAHKRLKCLVAEVNIIKKRGAGHQNPHDRDTLSELNRIFQNKENSNKNIKATIGKFTITLKDFVRNHDRINAVANIKALNNGK